jgi:hypothetical protein
MEQVPVLLQNNIITIRNSMMTLQRECADIYDAYWKTDANTTVSGLATGATPATVSSKFTKDNYTSGITLCENLEKFFANQAVSTADYLQTVDQCKYGDAVLGSQHTEATEQIGSRIKQLCLDVLEIYKQSLDITDLYFDSEMSDTVAVLDSHRIVYGCEMTASELSNTITMLQQYQNMIQNSSVTQGDYSATLSVLERLSAL